jgi:hypothetical protein
MISTRIFVTRNGAHSIGVDSAEINTASPVDPPPQRMLHGPDARLT